MRARPLGIAERDPLVLAGQDGVDDALVAKRLDVAAALELGFDLVDRARDVDRQHELQIDRQVCRLGRCRGSERRQGAHKRGSSLHARLLRRPRAYHRGAMGKQKGGKQKRRRFFLRRFHRPSFTAY